MGKLFLSHGVKYVALILGVIQTFFQKIAARVRILMDLCVMTADNIIGPQFLSFFDQSIKFKEAIAVDTGIWSTSV